MPSAEILSTLPSQTGMTIKRTIPAGETRQFSQSGQWFYVKELYASSSADASEDVEIQSDVSPPEPHNVGTGRRFNAAFKMITVRNTNASLAIYIEIAIGFGEYIDNRLNIVRWRPFGAQPVVDQPTLADGAGITSIAATTAVTYDGTPPTGSMQRKSITISNLDSALNLYIRDAGGAVLGVIFPETAQVYFISGEVQVYNPNGSSVNCFVGEIWYLNNTP